MRALQPTPYNDVNEFLAMLLVQVQATLGAHFVGMYISGSLVLGYFDPKTSDLDLVVVTDKALSGERIAVLQAMHVEVAAGDSPWAKQIEVVYITSTALRNPLLHAPDSTHYPQFEQEGGFFVNRLEDGWLSQCWIVREHGVTLAGPDPHTLIDPVDPNPMRRAVAQIARMWQGDATNDPTWLEWLGVRENQAFVTLTLCRLLYTLETGAVASKPAAARWAQGALSPRWKGLIARALAEKRSLAIIPDEDVTATVALVEYTVERFQQWENSSLI